MTGRGADVKPTKSAAKKPATDEPGPPPSIDDMPDVMTVEEVAAVMRASTRSVYSWISRGRLDCWRQGKMTRISKRQLVRFIEGGES